MMTLGLREASNVLKEADVLLFRHPPFPKLGWFIAKYSQSPYSHAGLYSRELGKDCCIEFREFIGSRKYSLKRYIEEGAEIDVFRVVPEITIPLIKYIDLPSLKGFYNFPKKLKFTTETAHKITDRAKELVKENTPYGWDIIWKMAKSFIPGLRLANGDKYIDGIDKNIYVCSTLITYTYRKYYMDPVNFLADDYTKPGDIARSAIMTKLCEIRGL